MITLSDIHLLKPKYQAAFVAMALQRGDSRPLLNRQQAATQGDISAQRALAILTTVKPRRVETGFLPLATLLAPALSKGATELVKLYAKARKGDEKAAAAYNQRIQAAREGDAMWLTAIAQAQMAAKAVKNDTPTPPPAALPE